MSKPQPSLEDLGLDSSIEKPFGKAFDNYDSSKEEQPKTWVDSVKLEPSGPSSVLAGLLACFLGPAGLWYKGCWKEGFGWLVTGMMLLPILILIPVVNVLFLFSWWAIMVVHAVVADARK